MTTSEPVELGTATKDTKEGGPHDVDNPVTGDGYLAM